MFPEVSPLIRSYTSAKALETNPELAIPYAAFDVATIVGELFYYAMAIPASWLATSFHSAWIGAAFEQLVYDLREMVVHVM